MYATEIDSHSYAFAETNIESNHLTHRINLRQPSSSTQLLPSDLWGEQNIDFIMCNPPFYGSFAALEAATAAKTAPPNSACTGSETEMVYEGGEVAFVGRILEESLALRTRVKWYSSLFGLRSSVDIFIGMLKEKGIENYTATEMHLGKTKRWAVAWSFGDRRPVVPGLQGCYPHGIRGEVEFTVKNEGQEEMVQSLLKDGGFLLTTLKSRPRVWYGEVREDTWSRAARRKKARDRAAGMDMDQQFITDKKGNGEEVCEYPSTYNENGEEVFVGMGFTIEVVEDKMKIIWRRGDGKLFESFAGMVKRKLTVDV
ncbi:Similar to Putative methyltransferase-like protein C27D7.08c; acc. no. O42662 [Pyronema omphalodes CBS 100304]|uniref:Similar to Putative methyltransferase-like protein C27D7.08c acc. no. O42662 n=1 Tax=Pyronema omphalodes (strain CBS 100304) TaxID=1076935 RepID=U4LIX6_PYROM|nr:Similar to Putative methyltransferase-like protein C27D7.08c; acc. no. O42662 [Pyronema omphalodes CBS 100304]